jgi:hypothetical protein
LLRELLLMKLLTLRLRYHCLPLPSLQAFFSAKQVSLLLLRRWQLRSLLWRLLLRFPPYFWRNVRSCST